MGPSNAGLGLLRKRERFLQPPRAYPLYFETRFQPVANRPLFGNLSHSVEQLLHALSPREADLALLRLRELLLDIAKENQLPADIVEHLKNAVKFSDRPQEGFKLSEVQEDYQTPEERLGRLRAERRLQQKADRAKSGEKRRKQKTD